MRKNGTKQKKEVTKAIRQNDKEQERKQERTSLKEQDKSLGVGQNEKRARQNAQERDRTRKTTKARTTD